MDSNYNKAYKEVVEVLNNVPVEDVKKIPNDLIQMFTQKMDSNYIYSIDNTKPFEEQEMLTETKAILANIYRDYWVSPEQKARMLAFQANELLKIEKEKKQNNICDTIYKTYSDVSVEPGITEETSLTICENETFLYKIKNFFKNIFNKK